MKRRLIGPALAVTLLMALSAFQTAAFADVAGSPAPAHLVMTSFHSRDLGLSFVFPLPPGTVEYAYGRCRSGSDNQGCNGPYYSWEITRTDSVDKGHIYWFAGYTGHESVGRESWPTDVDKWGRDSKGYWVSQGGNRVRVVGIEEMRTQDGSRALIFKPGDLSCDPGCSPTTFPYFKDRMAVINFAHSRAGFRVLVLYFEDPTPLSQIEASVRSVSFGALPTTGSNEHIPLVVGLFLLTAGAVLRTTSLITRAEA